MALEYDFLFESISALVARSRKRVYLLANSVLLDTYWQIGRLIVEDEQGGHGVRSMASRPCKSGQSTHG